MTAAALAFPGADPDVRIDGWIASRERAVNVAQGRLAELQAAGTRDFAGLAVAIREIGNLI